MSVPARTVVPMDRIDVDLMDGAPVAFVHDGRLWHVHESQRWFERVPWWETSRRMPKGTGRVDVMVWQVQARIGHNPRTPLVTFELVLGQDRVTWTCRSMVAVAA